MKVRYKTKIFESSEIGDGIEVEVIGIYNRESKQTLHSPFVPAHIDVYKVLYKGQDIKVMDNHFSELMYECVVEYIEDSFTVEDIE